MNGIEDLVEDLRAQVAALTKRVVELEGRTMPLVRLGGASTSNGRGLRKDLAEGGFIKAHGYFLAGEGPQRREGTRVCCAVSGRDLGPAD